MQPIVLLADDEASFLISARAILQNAGYAVTAIQSGDEVRAALADHSYDILLLDFQMPGNENLQLLRYLRDTDKREVDFVVLQDKRPLFAVEVKTGEQNVSAPAAYFKERTEISEFYQVHLGTRDVFHSGTGIRILPFTTFCNEKKLP